MVVAAVLGTQWLTVPALLFSWALIVLAFIDIEHYLLPDAITLPLLWLGLLVNCFGSFATPQAAIARNGPNGKTRPRPERLTSIIRPPVIAPTVAAMQRTNGNKAQPSQAPIAASILKSP